MPVELRKRKTPPQPAPAQPARKKAAGGIKGKVAKAKDAVKEVIGKGANKGAASAKPAAAKPAAASEVAVGSNLDLASFGGEIETNDGEKTTLAKLVEASKGGVVLFTYPKASTPGCTKQVCFFRDSYEPLTATGLSIYGLSTDSPKANTTFKTKQNLPYPLLCDPSASLIGAIGLKKAGGGTQRGVFVVDKSGKVLVAEPGSPEGTMNVVKKLVQESGSKAEAPAEDTKMEEPSAEDKDKAEVAAEVADTAAKVDGEDAAKAAT